MDEYEILKRKYDKLLAAAKLYRKASFQSHSGHWDMQGTMGKNCPECIMADETRAKANAIMEEIGER